MARAVFGPRSATSNATPSGVPQGTLGGVKSAAGRKPGNKLMVGDEGYLWILLLLELVAMAFLRKHFRRYHGG